MRSIIKGLVCFIFFCLCGSFISAQSFYRPWQSYKAVKPEQPYKTINTLTKNLSEYRCYYKGSYYELNKFITDLPIDDPEVFGFFKTCCATHPSRCAASYIGKNNKTLLYTMVEKKAYKYMEWILNEGFVYDSDIDAWGTYKEVNGSLIPIQKYNPMMLACSNKDLKAVKILRARGAYLSKPENIIGLTPYDVAMNEDFNPSSEFVNYIKKEYKEELANINSNKYYGKYFSLDNTYHLKILQLQRILYKSFPTNYNLFLQKVEALNPA